MVMAAAADDLSALITDGRRKIGRGSGGGILSSLVLVDEEAEEVAIFCKSMMMNDDYILYDAINGKIC